MPSIPARGARLALLAPLARAGRRAVRRRRPSPHGEPLVVRGTDTVVDGPLPRRRLHSTLTDGAFRGTPVGTGAYTGAIELRSPRASRTARAASARRSPAA